MRPFSASTFLGGVVLSAVISVPSAEADKARVLKATANVGGSYTFSVTVAHADSGWKHYADKFEVLAADGTVLETRILYHIRTSTSIPSPAASATSRYRRGLRK